MTTEEIIRTTLDDHIKVAAKYERIGNMKAAKELRAVANLLGRILQGAMPCTVLPDFDVEAVLAERRNSGHQPKVKRKH